MDIISNLAWVYYLRDKNESPFDDNKVGKWMYFFNDKEFAAKICKQSIEEGIVAESKHSNDEEGVCCFYLNCDDIEAHKRILYFFIENRLIKKTKAGKFYNISFKLDNQTLSGQYGADFHSDIKLENFIDLMSGEWIWDKTHK